MSLDEKIQKFKEKSENYYIRLLGNRVSAIAKPIILTGLTISAHGLINMEGISGQLVYFAGLAVITPSGAVDAMTFCGQTTPIYFKLTEESIKKHGNLEERFAKTLINGTENKKFIGYCQQQGMYLAAKKHGHKEKAKEYLKKYSNVKIPFF